MAILTHKFFAGMALGAATTEARLSSPQAATCFILFACATPAGVGAGLGLHAVSMCASTVLRALAAGVFLYLGTWHLITHAKLEGHEQLVRRWAWAAYAIGFGAMSTLAIWT